MMQASGTTLPYTINYTTISNVQTWTAQGNTMTPDPSTDIIVNGYAISSINLPNGTSWGFTYDSQSTVNPPSGASSGDLIGVTTPAGGSISYTYTSTPLPPLVVPVGQQLTGGDLYVYRCNGACHAVASRTESDGLSSSIPGIHSWTTHYTYGMYTQAQQQSLFPSCPMVPMPAGEPSVFYAFWTTETDPLGNDTVHSFCPVGVSNAIPVANQYHETMTQSYQESAPSPTTGTGTGGTGTLLKTVTTSLQYQADIPTPNGQGNAGNINILPTQITTTIPSGSTTASTTDGRQYSSLFTATKIGCGQGFNTATDAVNDRYSTCEPYPSGSLSSSPPRTIPIYYLSPTTEKTYSGTSTSGTPLRTTWTAYMFSTQNPPTGYANTYMSALPLSVANTDPTGNTTYSQTTYGYDTTGRGYLVSQSQWLNTTGQNVTTQTWYNSLGMPYESLDAKGNLTFVSGFMNQCSAGTSTYPQVVTKAYGSTTTLPELSTYNFDCYTNAMTSVTDPNGVQTSYNYTADPLGRLTQAKYGINSTIPSTITLSYRSMTEVDINQDQSTLNDGVITKKTIFDGLGRTIQQKNSAGYIVTTVYNPDGEVGSVTNPQGADSVYGTSSSSGGTDGTNYYYYDPLGRVIKETEQDGSTLWWCYNGIQDSNYPQPTGLCSSNPSTTNSGAVSWIDSTDENGNHHQHVSNALGQLIAVIEPNPQTNVLALETDYTYDPNGNLSNVNQHGAAGETARIRSFNYDSLSRLLCASNPETSSASCPNTATGSYLSGTTGYMYDLNGNLQSKTDARGIITSYTYDGLNRVLSKSYSSNDPSGAPSSCYQYDSASTYGIGRLGNQWTQKGTCSSSPGAGVPSLTSISAYDAMGRVKSEQQCVFSNCSTDYPSLPTYNYDLAGDLTKYSDGLGTRYFTKQYDKATRLQTMTAGPSSFTLFSAQGYGASGGVTSAFYGTTTPNAGVSQSRTYDSRLRVTGETDGQN